MPGVCERWLADRERVVSLRERLGDVAESDQRIGQTFCNVLAAWGRDLAAQGLPVPEQQAVIMRPAFDDWTAAMKRYGALTDER